MNLLNLIVLIIVIGMLLWGVNAFIPMAPLIKSALNFLILVVVVIYILQFFGLIKTLLPFPNIFK